ncbi:WD40-repeat-containing domain protein [Schizophyllum amplum]|uniref:WD40-repeat-containing domain protein n=1 Tax=Schizophyllum amplum TaxID=97359 RepID=A0A550BS34_9AGAR|nr:WD40-repeat-containing domain protein [Auriculariopsis ampla]
MCDTPQMQSPATPARLPPPIRRLSMENDSTFVAPEGVYTVTEDHKPAIVLPNQPPATYPTRVRSIVVRFPQPKQGAAPFAQLLGNSKKDGKKPEREAQNPTASPREDGVSLSSSDTDDDLPLQTPVDVPAGSPNLSALEQRHLFSPARASSKKKHPSRPKHNMRTTSSTFVTRMQSVEGLTKALQSRQGDTTFLFYNHSKTFVWVEAGAKSKEPLVKITFSAYPTCHDVNASTASPEHIDIVIGFSTGDLVWLDPITCRYARLNKGGFITNSPCTAVRWVPSSPTLFLVSHADGTIIVYDKEREDGAFSPQDPAHLSPPPSDGSSSSDSWDPMGDIFVSLPPWHPVSSGPAAPKADKDKAAKNPVSHWRVSRRAVVDFVFAPDVKYVAVVAEDGCLRIIDAISEQLVDCYASYFGALTSVAWSPDGRFIITGGQDDLLTIFSPWEQRVIARCQGHSSFVSSVAFDELRCDGRTYRFGSVGEDNKLILWDFSSGALHRPKYQATHHQRMSMSSTISLGLRRDKSALYLPSLNSPGVDGDSSPRYHPAPARNDVAVVQPVLVKHLDGDLLGHISFIPRCILTSTRGGHIRLWIRPLALRPRHPRQGHMRAVTTDVEDLL